MEQNKEQWYIIRSKEAGAFFAHIDARRGDEVDLRDARRLWYWDGAASLSQMAVDGVSNPLNCKFTVIVPSMTVLGVCEIIPCTDKAVESVQGVKVWRR